jgi:hypothetical protein
LAAGAIANTHYYGVILVIANFVFFTLLALRGKFGFRRWFMFLLANGAAAAFFMPFFIYTALNRALLDQNFNSWIPAPGAQIYLFLVAAASSVIVYIYIRRKSLAAYFSSGELLFLDYSVWVSSVIFALAFLVSLYHPMLVMRYYYTICFPLMIAVAAVAAARIFSTAKSLVVKIVCAAAAFLFFASLCAEERVEADITGEALAYIGADVKACGDISAALIMSYSGTAPAFYNLSILPYDRNSAADVVYMVPVHTKMDELYKQLDNYGFGERDVLRINLNSQKALLKVFLK